MIDLTIDKPTLEKNIQKAKAKGIIVPTFSQMRDPVTVPAFIKETLKKTAAETENSINTAS